MHSPPRLMRGVTKFYERPGILNFKFPVTRPWRFALDHGDFLGISVIYQVAVERAIVPIHVIPSFVVEAFTDGVFFR
jgi:hypothetical protein